MICYWSEYYVTTKFMICNRSKHSMLRPSLWFVTGQNAVCYDQVYDLLMVITLWYDQVYDLLLVRMLYVMTKFVICYWSKHCMLRPSWWFFAGQNAVCYDQVYNSLLVRTLCYDQLYDLLLVRTLYGMTKFMICYRSKHCMLRPSLWFVTGPNTERCDQVYDLLLVRTLYGMSKFMIFTGQNAVCYDQVCDLLLVKTLYYDQVYDLLLVRALYVTTKFMICYFSKHCMLPPSLLFVTGQNAVCYNQVYDLLLVRILYVTTKFMICYWSKHYATTKFKICYWSEPCML